MADPNASGKTNRFVGICIQRGGNGLGATFVLRNIINNQGKISYAAQFSIEKHVWLKMSSRNHSNPAGILKALNTWHSLKQILFKCRKSYR